MLKILSCSVQSGASFHTVQKQHSLDMSLLLLVPSRSSRHQSILGALVFQFQVGHLFLRPSGICSAARSFFSSERQAEDQADNNLCSLLHVGSFFSSRTSFGGSLLFFYFEVEFPHLCLSLSLQWLDANPSLTFSSFSTSYAPRL